MRVKFCGLQREEDVQAAVARHVDYLGFIFAESKRRVEPEAVARWTTNVTTPTVGVFVNATVDEMLDIGERAYLSIIQCHGDETVERVAQLRAKTGRSIWKVFHVTNDAPLPFRDYAPYVDAFVVDYKVGTQYGGTGQSFDWTLLPRLQKEARAVGREIIVAGGVRADNVRQLTDVFAIDLSSGIERDGMKCPSKMDQLLAEVR